MLKKLMAVFFCLALFMLSGCSESRRIDTAALAEDVTVDSINGQTIYSFYLLSSDEAPWAIDIPADSFEQACELARQKYIPNISLPKIKMLMINSNIYKQTMRRDIEYISTQSAFSPIMNVTLCDSGTIKAMKEDKRVPEIIENELRLIKEDTDRISTNCVSVFNSIVNDKDGFAVSYISSDTELKIDTINIIV